MEDLFWWGFRGLGFLIFLVLQIVKEIDIEIEIEVEIEVEIES